MATKKKRAKRGHTSAKQRHYFHILALTDAMVPGGCFKERFEECNNGIKLPRTIAVKKYELKPMRCFLVAVSKEIVIMAYTCQGLTNTSINRSDGTSVLALR